MPNGFKGRSRSTRYQPGISPCQKLSGSCQPFKRSPILPRLSGTTKDPIFLPQERSGLPQMWDGVNMFQWSDVHPWKWGTWGLNRVKPTATYPHHTLAGSQMPTHSALHTKALFPWQLLGRMLAVGRDLSRFVQQQLGFIQQKYAKNRNWSTVGTEKGSPNLVSTIHSFWSRTFQSSSLSCIYWGLPGKWIWWYRPVIFAGSQTQKV